MLKVTANMARILKTMAIFVLIGPLVGMAVALNWILPGGKTSLRDLFDISILAYILGGPFAILAGIGAVLLKRFGRGAALLGTPLVAAAIGMISGWFVAVCCCVAALVCALLDAWWNPPARVSDAPAADAARPAP